jgi:hypothetical protein
MNGESWVPMRVIDLESIEMFVEEVTSACARPTRFTWVVRLAIVRTSYT